MLVIGLTGKRGTGKDTVAEYLARKYRFKVLTYTNDVLAPILKKQGKEILRKNLVELAMSMRKKHGTDILTKMLCDTVKEDGLYVISGVRFPEEVKHFKKRFGDSFKLIALVCNDKERYKRIKKRGTKGEGSLSFHEFLDMENLPTEAPIKNTMKLADVFVDNNRNFNELYASIDEMIKHFQLK